MTADHPIPTHATRARYNSRVAKCRCARCRRANTEYMRLYRDRARYEQLDLIEELT